MAVGVIWYPPIDRQTYDTVSDRVRETAASKGLRFHAAGEGDGAWRIIEIWESRDGLEDFIREDLAPTIDDVSGGQAPQPEPEVVFEIVNELP
jgi:hypothetical protein